LSRLRLSASGHRHKPRYSAFFHSRLRSTATCSGLHATPRTSGLSKCPPAAFHQHRAPIAVDHSRLIDRRLFQVAPETFSASGPAAISSRSFERASLAVDLPVSRPPQACL
jgi:hypothetical protein